MFERCKSNIYLMVCKLFICFLPSLAMIFCAEENWPALILTVLLCATSTHEVRKEDAK